MSDIGYFKLSRCYQHLSGRGTAPIQCLSTRTQLEHRDHQTTETGFSSHTACGLWLPLLSDQPATVDFIMITIKYLYSAQFGPERLY